MKEDIPNSPSYINAIDNSPLSIISSRLTNWFKEKNWESFGIASAVFIFLTVLGVLVRLLAAYYFRENYSFYTTPPIWERNVLFNPADSQLNGYADFSFYYVNWVEAWYKDGWYPFTDWRSTILRDPLYYYSYPPIFLYFIVLIWRPGMSVIWIAMPLIVTDAACAGMVYLIVDKLVKGTKSKGVAFIAGMLMVFSPINIIYDGVFWLNPGPVTLFTLISFYFILERKWWQVFFWLAIATMTKQNALFFTYPLFFVMLGEKVKEKGIKRASFESFANVLLFISMLLIISAPWIFITPIHYFVHLLYPGKMLTTEPIVGEPDFGQSVPISWSLYYYGIRGIFGDIIAFSINSMFLMIASASIIGVYLMWRSFRGKLDNTEFFELISIYTIWTHIFMPRGVFKFYSAYYVPIIIVALVSSLAYYKVKKIAFLSLLSLAVILFMGFNLWHEIIHPYFIPLLLFISSLMLMALFGLRRFYRHKVLSITF